MVEYNFSLQLVKPELNLSKWAATQILEPVGTRLQRIMVTRNLLKMLFTQRFLKIFVQKGFIKIVAIMLFVYVFMYVCVHMYLQFSLNLNLAPMQRVCFFLTAAI